MATTEVETNKRNEEVTSRPESQVSPAGGTPIPATKTTPEKADDSGAAGDPPADRATLEGPHDVSSDLSEEAAGNPPAELEVIGGYRVHPLASRFPLLNGEEFEQLMESIRVAGRAAAVELHEGLLIDGRNRVRAIEHLRASGHDIPLETVEWAPVGTETVEEHIFAVNVYRRHLTDDQRVMLATALLPVLRQAAAARQAASRFGGSRSPADTKSCPPAGSTGGRRSRNEKLAKTIPGELARLSRTTPHKATKAIALADAVNRGEVPREKMDAVTRGDEPLRKIAPNNRKPRRSRGQKTAREKLEQTPAENFWDRASDTEEPTSEAPVEQEFLAVSEVEVRSWWEQFKEQFSDTEHRELRSLLSQIIAEEQAQFDAS